MSARVLRSYVDALGTAGRPHVDNGVVDEEVPALDELNSHLFGKVGVFEIG